MVAARKLELAVVNTTPDYKPGSYVNSREEIEILLAEGYERLGSYPCYDLISEDERRIPILERRYPYPTRKELFDRLSKSVEGNIVFARAIDRRGILSVDVLVVDVYVKK